MTGIYISFPPIEVVVTTTPYPVDYADGVIIGCRLGAGWMAPIVYDQVATDHDVVSMTYVQERWYITGDLGLDEVAVDQNVIAMTYVQERWFITGDLGLDEMAVDHNVISMTKENKLVEADTPDEELQINCRISDTCTMTLV